jgi:two-component system cell cycle sensor histidine kinase/response regulator CckA
VDADGYRILFDANPLPIFASDTETLRILIVNRAMCELYGWSREEFATLTLRDIRPPQEVATFEAAFAAAKGETYARHANHCTKDGRVLEVTLEITRGFEFDGRPASLAVVTDVTGIAHAERRFRLLVEHSSDGISLTSADGVVEYVSPAGRRILGYPEEEIIGKTLHRLIVHPEDRTDAKIAPGATQHLNARVRHQDGSWRWFEIVTTNLTHDAAVRAYVTNFRDITERKMADQMLRQQQQRLEFLLSATSAVTYTALVDGKPGAAFISSNVNQVLGYQPADFYNDTQFWPRHIHPDDAAITMARIKDAVANDDSLTMQYRFRHSDGSYRWMRDSCRIIRDAERKFEQVVGYWIDVTDHVRAEESVRRSEANFRTLIERAPTATFVHRDGRFLYVNPAAVAMLGVDGPDKIVGTPVLDFVYGEDRDAVRQRMDKLTGTGRVTPSSGRMRRADGSVFVLEGEAMRLDFDGEPSNVVMGVDATERQEMFARMALADRMLSVGTLAAGVAHEINNPLAYIATNLEVLAAELPNVQPTRRSRLTDSTLQALVTDARDGVARVSAIVRDLRALSRPDHEDDGPVDVLAVLGSSIKIVHNEIRHRARVVQGWDERLPFVDGNPSRLGQVFLNLLLNAAQAIPEGHADRNEIRVRAYADAKRVRIEITDTGCGIPASVIRRIFDPFFTTKAPGQGTGLGLAISHQIVSSMGGDITVTSRVGEGSTFSVSLPIAATQRAPAPAAPEPVSKATSRILLIDDEPAVGRALGMLLAPETEVVAVHRAEDALARLASGERYDAIVCDLMMPEISGIELYDRLERVAPECRHQVIFMTGGAFTPQAREFLAKLEQPHLEKPFSESQLRRAIESVRQI